MRQLKYWQSKSKIFLQAIDQGNHVSGQACQVSFVGVLLKRNCEGRIPKNYWRGLQITFTQYLSLSGSYMLLSHMRLIEFRFSGKVILYLINRSTCKPCKSKFYMFICFENIWEIRDGCWKIHISRPLIFAFPINGSKKKSEALIFLCLVST